MAITFEQLTDRVKRHPNPNVRTYYQLGYSRGVAANWVGKALQQAEVGFSAASIRASHLDEASGLTAERIAEIASAQGEAGPTIGEITDVLSALGFDDTSAELSALWWSMTPDISAVAPTERSRESHKPSGA